MKASKFIVLVGGILGILAFFLPMVSVEREGKTGSLSAFQIVKGVDAAKSEINRDEVRTEAASFQGGSRALAGANEGLDGIKTFVFAVFAPALLLVLLGAAGVARKKFGRVAGTFSLLAGIAGLGIAALMKSAAGADGGIAITLLLVTGVAGLAGGIITLVKPDRGVAAATPAMARAAA